jgi:type I restriction enzyme S subunit
VPYVRVEAAALSRYGLRDGDLVIARTGASTGASALIQNPPTAAVFASYLVRFRTARGVNARYVSYILRGPAFRDFIYSVAHDKSAQPNASASTIATFSFELPPLPDQERASALLGALDDKIDLNRRMNDTIQKLLRAAFHEVIGTGESVEIGALAKVVGGSTPSTANPKFWEDGIFAWATPKDLAALADPVLLGTGRHVTGPGLAQISSGLLPAGTVLMSSRAPIGYLAIAEIPVAVNQGFIAMIPEGRVSKHFLLWWADSCMDEIKARANGTTFQEISKSHFRPMIAEVPGAPDLKRFDEIAEPLFELLVANARENLVLAQLRDALLPELISGRMTVN